MKQNYYSFRQWLKNYLAIVNKDALWIFGVQKSGTSAIASLLAERTKQSVTIDTHYLWEPYLSNLNSGSLTLKEITKKYSYPFSRDIIKEPAATFFIEKVEDVFKLNKYVFIVRNPYDNIRSILNRLELPGNKKNVSLNKINHNWQYLFKESRGENYVEVLTKHWLKANSQYQFIENKGCIVVTYEDFLKDKKQFIDNLAHNLSLDATEDISHLLNKAFQPRGNSKVNLFEFFGEENLNLITKLCANCMKYHGYEPLQ